jgi:hypothetical protein
MDKAHKASNSECYTPSSEPLKERKFSIQLAEYAQIRLHSWVPFIEIPKITI